MFWISKYHLHEWKLTPNPSVHNMMRSMKKSKKKAITDEEGDVRLTRFDVAFCSIDHMDPDGVKEKKNQGQMH